MAPRDSYYHLNDDFAGNGDLSPRYINFNPGIANAVGRVDNRYRFELTDNSSNRSAWFNTLQGQGFFKITDFQPGKFYSWICRNIGIGQTGNSQLDPTLSGNPFTFAGCNIHPDPLTDADSAHVVVGYRGSTSFGGSGRTVEFKNTVGGSSTVTDAGTNIITNTRADLLFELYKTNAGVVTLVAGWQNPNLNWRRGAPDNFDMGTSLPGSLPTFGTTIYIGLITYAFELGGLPFVGTCDAIQANPGGWSSSFFM